MSAGGPYPVAACLVGLSIISLAAQEAIVSLAAMTDEPLLGR